MVRGHEQEGFLSRHVRLGRGTGPARRDPVHDEAGLVADDHDDTLDPCRKQVPYGTTSQAEAASIDALAQIVVSRIQGVKGVTRTLTCSVVHI